jgi:hypothetical protein
MSDETTKIDLEQAAEWEPDAIRAWCARTGRNPAMFLEPSPPQNPPPSVVERMAGVGRDVSAEYAALAPRPDIAQKDDSSPVGASAYKTPTHGTQEHGDAPGAASRCRDGHVVVDRWRYCELPAGHAVDHGAYYCGEWASWPQAPENVRPSPPPDPADLSADMDAEAADGWGAAESAFPASIRPGELLGEGSDNGR